MSRSPVASHPDGALVLVWVVPRASRSEIVGWRDGRLRVRVSVPPEGGRANEEVARLLSERLGATVELFRGATAREKEFLARGVEYDFALEKLSDKA